MIATGVGAPIGAGILIGMAASGGIQMLTTGHIDMNQLAISGIVGGVGGGVGSLVAGMPAVAGLASAIGDTSPLAASAVTNGITGAAQGFAMSATGQLLSNGRIDPAQLALGTATGGATGAVAGPAIDALASRVSGGVVNAASTSSGQVAETPLNILPSSGRTFVGTPRGTIYDIPQGWLGRTADNAKGIVFQRSGALGKADMIRIMEPTVKYPSGYARYFNEHGQPLDVFGKPGSRATTHIPEDYKGPLPWWPK